MKNDVPEPIELDDVDTGEEDDEEPRPVYAPWAVSSIVDRVYWKTTPHPFAAARWGHDYCSLCAATETGEGVEHLDVVNLPFGHPWRLGVHETIHPGHAPRSTWHVEGWSDAGAGCSYEVDRSMDASIARAQRYAEQGDETGRRYDHYAVKETVVSVLATLFVHPVPVADPVVDETQGA